MFRQKQKHLCYRDTNTLLCGGKHHLKHTGLSSVRTAYEDLTTCVQAFFDPFMFLKMSAAQLLEGSLSASLSRCKRYTKHLEVHLPINLADKRPRCTNPGKIMSGATSWHD